MKLLKTLVVGAFLVALLATAGAAVHLIRQPVRSTPAGAAVPSSSASVSPSSSASDPSAAPTSPPPAPTPMPMPMPTTPTPTPTPAPVDVLAPGQRGEPVRELQSRLFQLAWLPELTTGTYDAATRAAVSGFQAKRGLPSTGRVDPRTWKRLLAMTKQPTQDAMDNVLHPGPSLLATGADGDDVRALQARLKALDWWSGDVTGAYDTATVSAVRGFQAKRQIPVTGAVDQRTMDRLTAMTSTPTHDAMYNIEPQPGALDARCLTGSVICIDKTSQTLRWVVDGHVERTMDVRFGASYSPTREGLFHLQSKDADHVSHLYGSAMPYSMFFSGGQAVHYSSDFAARGYAGASHGCVNVRDHAGISWLFGQAQVGDAVVIYWS